MQTTDDILKRLVAGNARFVADKLDGQLQDSSRRGELTSKQQPYAIVLSCSDSRVVPELAFDTGLGELFVIRVAGNIANTSSIASIEYAVAELDVGVIVVMGHESCGAVTAAITGGDLGPNIAHLLSHIEPAKAAAGEGASLEAVVKKNAQLVAAELRDKSEIIRKAGDRLDIVPAYYELESGKVQFF